MIFLLLLINTILNKYITETLISLLEVEIRAIQVLILCFYPKLRKKKSQTRPVFHFFHIYVHDLVVLKLFVGIKLRNLIPAKFNTFKVNSP